LIVVKKFIRVVFKGIVFLLSSTAHIPLSFLIVF